VTDDQVQRGNSLLHIKPAKELLNGRYLTSYIWYHRKLSICI